MCLFEKKVFLFRVVPFLFLRRRICDKCHYTYLTVGSRHPMDSPTVTLRAKLHRLHRELVAQGDSKAAGMLLEVIEEAREMQQEPSLKPIATNCSERAELQSSCQQVPCTALRSRRILQVAMLPESLDWQVPPELQAELAVLQTPLPELRAHLQPSCQEVPLRYVNARFSGFVR